MLCQLRKYCAASNYEGARYTSVYVCSSKALPDLPEYLTQALKTANKGGRGKKVLHEFASRFEFLY